MYSQNLQELGYSEKESKVILALNEYGAMPASTISRVTGLKRSSVYNVLIPLKESNIISYYKQGNHNYFVIDDLNKLYYLAKEKLALSKNLVMRLQHANSHVQNIQVNYYRGQQGYFEVYKEMLKVNPAEILCWVDFRFLSIIQPEEEEKYLQERLQRNIPARILMTDSAGARRFKSKDHGLKRETRLLGGTFTFETTAFLYEDYVAIFDFQKPITAIRIHHPGIYKMFLQIFNAHWQIS